MLQGKKRLSANRWHLGQTNRQIGNLPGLRPMERLLSTAVLARHVPTALDGLYPESWLEYRKDAEAQQIQQIEEVRLTQLTLKLGLELSEYFLTNVEKNQTVMQVNSMYRTLMTCLTALETHNRELTREIRQQIRQLPRPGEQKTQLAANVTIRAEELKQYAQTKLEQLQQVFPISQVRESHTYYHTSTVIPSGEPQAVSAPERKGSVPGSETGRRPEEGGNTLRTVIVPPPAWKWDPTAYRRQFRETRGVRVHREQLLILLTQTTQEEQENIWREVRSETELTQLCKRVEQRQETETAPLIRLVQESNNQEYIRLIHTLEKRFIQKVSRDTSIEVQENYTEGSRVRRTELAPEEVVRKERQVLAKQAAPVLTWLEQTLKAGRMRREKMLEHLEEQPEAQREAFLTLAGGSGAFSERSLPTRQWSTAEERLTLLVQKSSRRELEKLLQWVREETKPKSGAVESILTTYSEQEAEQFGGTEQNGIAEHRVIRGAEPVRSALRTLVYFLERNPSQQLLEETESSVRRENVLEKHAIRLLQGMESTKTTQEAEYLEQIAQRADLQHRVPAEHPAAEWEKQTQQRVPVPEPQKSKSIPKRRPEPEMWEGTPLQQRLQYREIRMIDREIQEIRAVREQKTAHRLDFHPIEQIYLTPERVQRFISRRSENTVERVNAPETHRERAAQPEAVWNPVPYLIREQQELLRERNETVFETHTSEIEYHKMLTNRSVADKLEETVQIVRNLQTINRAGIQQERSRHTSWVEHATVVRDIQNGERRHIRRSVEQELSFRRQTQHLEQQKEILQQQREVVHQEQVFRRRTERQESVYQTQTIRRETAVLSRMIRNIEQMAVSTKRTGVQNSEYSAAVGQQVLAKLVRDGEARILERQTVQPVMQQRARPVQRAETRYEHTEADLELRRTQKPETVRETAAQAARQVVEANIQQQNPELRVLRRQSQEQEKALLQQQEQIGGLRQQLEKQEALVRQSIERAAQTSTEPAQIRKVTKAVMRELEDQIRLERQRRGMK